MHRRHRHREPARPPRPLFARIALGGTIAIAVLSAGLCVVIPPRELSPPQRGAAGQAFAATASAPLAKVARGGTADP